MVYLRRKCDKFVYENTEVRVNKQSLSSVLPLSGQNVTPYEIIQSAIRVFNGIFKATLKLQLVFFNFVIAEILQFNTCCNYPHATRAKLCYARKYANLNTIDLLIQFETMSGFKKFTRLRE